MSNFFSDAHFLSKHNVGECLILLLIGPLHITFFPCTLSINSGNKVPLKLMGAAVESSNVGSVPAKSFISTLCTHTEYKV